MRATGSSVPSRLNRQRLGDAVDTRRPVDQAATSVLGANLFPYVTVLGDDDAERLEVLAESLHCTFLRRDEYGRDTLLFLCHSLQPAVSIAYECGRLFQLVTPPVFERAQTADEPSGIALRFPTVRTACTSEADVSP